MSEPSGPAVPDAIAERVFEKADGQEVRALIGRPREGERDWECHFQIVGVGDEMVHTAAGVDSLQALHIALAMMAVQVEGYQQEHGLTLYGDPELLLMKPDIDSLTSGLEARPDYPQWRPAR